MSKDRLLSDEESKQMLYDLFGQNFLDGDKPVEWKAAMINASSIKEYIDDFVAPMLDTQKRLYAESVIGEDEDIETLPPTMSSDYINYVHAQNRLRAEQRESIKR